MSVDDGGEMITPAEDGKENGKRKESCWGKVHGNKMYLPAGIKGGGTWKWKRENQQRMETRGRKLKAEINDWKAEGRKKPGENIQRSTL